VSLVLFVAFVQPSHIVVLVSTRVKFAEALTILARWFSSLWMQRLGELSVYHFSLSQLFT
jgi:hypothetical protein